MCMFRLHYGDTLSNHLRYLYGRLLSRSVTWSLFITYLFSRPLLGKKFAKGRAHYNYSIYIYIYCHAMSYTGMILYLQSQTFSNPISQSAHYPYLMWSYQPLRSREFWQFYHMEGDSLAHMDCEVCCDEAAQCLCYDCSPEGTPLCSSCSELLHHNPKRTGHSLVSIISHENFIQ